MSSLVLGYIGLSHLGLCYSAASAEKGFKVYSFDEDKTKVKKLINNENYVFEKNLDKILKRRLNKNIHFYDHFQNLNKCDIVFISEDVPTDNNGKSNLNNIKKTITKATKFLNKNATLVILSQVHPGFTRKINWHKNKLYYQVETLIFGQAILRAKKPERIIIGANNENIHIEKNYKFFLNSFKCPILKMNYESAEITKISINFLLISNISSANLLSKMCENIGADWLDVIPALRMDKRIGNFSYIEPGLGLSGGNLERDLFTLKKLSKNLRINDKIIDSYIYSSKKNKLWVYDKLKNLISSKKKNYKIAMLGLTYKENTNSIKNSASIFLLKKLYKKNIVVYDPKANLNNLNFKVRRVSSVSDALINADVLIIMNKWDEFFKIGKNLIYSKMKGKLIIDPFGVLKNLNLSQCGFDYKRLGN